MKYLAFIFVLSLACSGCKRDMSISATPKGIPMTDKIKKSDAEWMTQLTPEQFKVARKKGTERAFTGATWDNKKEGIYHCVCCDLPLFPSTTKYESGTGWPSFFQPIAQDNVALESDRCLLRSSTLSFHDQVRIRHRLAQLFSTHRPRQCRLGIRSFFFQRPHRSALCKMRRPSGPCF